eukprot:TRINITY_DN3781_c0_g1_i1.p2 TRINITY_DN3781_c0_g1~~TRINITY_DN3781_c0_g1_i1.p2  ORF type:complete len:335 (+),score=121.83 TRINITY_DN3781_c0_g1_i1:48-1052(+)
MHTMLPLLAFAASASAQLLTASYVEENHAAMWTSFKSTYARSYAVHDEPVRKATFKANMLRAAERQAAELAAGGTATYGVTKFADYTEEEMTRMSSGVRVPGVMPRATRAHSESDVLRLAAGSKDWRDLGAVSAVQQQGDCGGCWSFSVTGTIEGTNVAQGNTLAPLSEQFFISCDKDDLGCNGGLPYQAYQWAIDNNKGRCVTEAAYPYVSGDGSEPACKDFSAMPVGATIKGWERIPTDAADSEAQIRAALLAHGPISIAVDVCGWGLYTGGIMKTCPSGMIGHGVVAVGVSDDAWIVKNSWGAEWGENGYVRLAYGSNQCGITTMPTYVTY